MADVVEPEIIRGCQAGDRTAQRRLFEDTSTRVYRLILRFTGNPDDAWDITQEAFYKVLTRIHQFDGRSAFTTWLHRIAMNEALQHRRRAKTLRRKLDNLAGILRGARDSIAEVLPAEQQEEALGELGRWRTRDDAALWFALCWAEGRRPR